LQQNAALDGLIKHFHRFISPTSLRAMKRFEIGLLVFGFVTGSSVVAQPVTVVQSTNAPVWGASPRLVQELRIGVIDGDDEYMFGGIDGVAIGAQGNIFVADGKVPIVREYDAAGKFIRNIGGKGSGPGEYRQLGAIRTFADGRLAVWDNGAQRLNTYTGTGLPLASAHVPSGLHSADLMHVDRTGNVFIKTALNLDPVTHAFTLGWIRVSPTLQLLDTVKVPPSIPGAGFVLQTNSGPALPFVPDSISTIAANGEVLTGFNGRYSFELRKKGAATVRIERAFTPLRVARGEHAEWTTYAENLADVRRRDPARPQTLPPTFVIPLIKPAYSDLTSDADGRIWVRRYIAAELRPAPERRNGRKGPEQVWREPPTYDVFEPTGRLLGTIVLPWDATFADAVGMQVYVVATGRDGEESVQRFRVQTSK